VVLAVDVLCSVLMVSVETWWLFRKLVIIGNSC
jgi:hypothetical protein